MRTVLKSLVAVALVVPALAFAAITNTKHDLSNISTTTTRSTAAGGSDQTCIFCHTPHRATVQALIWNRQATAVTTYSWGTETRTNAGTQLATGLGDKSKVCLSCHDGSISLGQVANSNGAAATFAMQGNVTGGGNLTNAGGALMGAGGAMGGNHPISIPYPVSGGSAYNGITSAVTSATQLADFATTSTTCTNNTGNCTTATNGALINLYAPATGTGLGIECGSCHDVHNKYPTNAYFLRVGTAQSAICKACHVK